MIGVTVPPTAPNPAENKIHPEITRLALDLARHNSALKQIMRVGPGGHRSGQILLVGRVHDQTATAISHCRLNPKWRAEGDVVRLRQPEIPHPLAGDNNGWGSLQARLDHDRGESRLIENTQHNLGRINDLGLLLSREANQ